MDNCENQQATVNHLDINLRKTHRGIPVSVSDVPRVRKTLPPQHLKTNTKSVKVSKPKQSNYTPNDCNAELVVRHLVDRSKASIAKNKYRLCVELKRDGTTTLSSWFILNHMGCQRCDTIEKYINAQYNRIAIVHKLELNSYFDRPNKIKLEVDNYNRATFYVAMEYELLLTIDYLAEADKCCKCCRKIVGYDLVIHVVNY